jgi:hypothetical protein
MKCKATSEVEVVELDAQQLEAKLDQIEQVMGHETARPFRTLLSWYLKLLTIIQLKNTSIARLRQLLFGKKTERLSDVLSPAETPHDSVAGSDRDPPQEDPSLETADNNPSVDQPANSLPDELSEKDRQESPTDLGVA